MTLLQLRYLIAVAQCGSISAAAHRLFVSQSRLSVAVRDLERETGVTVFERSRKGITLTREGVELLAYARQVVEQADLMEQRYRPGGQQSSQRLSVSTQHYAFCVEAFLEFVGDYEGAGYAFTLRETRTAEIIADVSDFRSDVGVLYLSGFNRRALLRAFDDAGLRFTALFTAQPHVFVGEGHPLAGRAQVTPADLEPFPRYSFDQGAESSFSFAEEPLAELPHEQRVIISDRGTLSNLLAHHTGYTVSTGILSSEMHTGIVSVPLKTEEVMEIGYVVHGERQLSALAQCYIERLRVLIEQQQLDYAAL